MKTTTNISSLLTSLFFLLLFCNCENEPVGSALFDTFDKESKLYEYINTIADSNKNSTCVTFIYPISLFEYNSSLEIINQTSINSDDEFLSFLNSLSNNNSISISYPIQTVLDDGSLFSINNNTELKDNLEECYKEITLLSCYNICEPENTTQRCLWKVDFNPNYNNNFYLSSFENNGDGTYNYYHDNETLNATWVFLFINEKLHLNINIEGQNESTAFWNFDWEVIHISFDKIIIKKDIYVISLVKTCTEQKLFTVGELAPAGGIVIYDKGSYSNGWRYIEVTTNYIDENDLQWGCNGQEIINCNNVSIGSGLTNTKMILAYHFNMNFYANPLNCNISNNGIVAAQKSSIFEENNFIDWFLPSTEECELLFNILHLQNSGNLTFAFWSSTQKSDTEAFYFNITNEEIQYTEKTTNLLKIKPIRYF